MATLTIRNLPEPTRRALKERAARHNLSMEAEVRAIIEAALGRDRDFVGAWLDATESLHVGLELPERRPARDVEVG